MNAIVDSSGNDYDGTVYKKGSTKTIYAYLPVGETVYKAGTPVTKIGSGHSSHIRYKGNGSSGYLRGDSVTRYSISSTYRNAYTYDSSRERYESIGTVYKVSSGTYYRGNGGYVVDRGDPINAIDFHGTLYENGGSVTPIGSAVYNAYQRNAEDDETFSAIGSECSLKLATFTTRDVTALTI